MSHSMLCLKTKNLVFKGSVYHLFSNESNVEILPIYLAPIVKDVPNVFPDDIQRKIDFGIYITQDTRPFSFLHS